MTNVPGVYAGGRHHRAAVAGARGELGGDPVRRGFMYHGKKPRKVTVFPGCTYCQPQVASVGTHRTRRQGQGDQVQGGQVPVPGERQGTGGGRGGRVRKNPLRRGTRRGVRCAHHRPGGDGTHRGDGLGDHVWKPRTRRSKRRSTRTRRWPRRSTRRRGRRMGWRSTFDVRLTGLDE